MSSQSVIEPKRTAKVVILAGEDSTEKVQRFLARHCHQSSLREGEVVFLPFDWIAARNVAKVQQVVSRFIPSNRLCIVLAPPAIRYSNSSSYVKVVPYRSLIELDAELPHYLKSLGLDWLQVTGKLLQNGWIHGAEHFSPERIEKWIEQFERLGERYIGEGLIKSLELWLPLQQREALDLANAVQNYDAICVNRIRPGKSGDFLASILTKAIGANGRKVLEFPSAIQDGYAGKKILLVEDGLFTGTEVVNFFSGLLGLPHPRSRTRNVAAVANPEFLRETPVALTFVRATRLGILRVERFVAEQKLSHLSLSVPKDSIIENLTSLGAQAWRDGRFFDPDVYDCPVNCDEHLIRPAFLPDVWGSEEKARRVRQFCETIGSQLFSNYVNWKGWSWESKRLARFGLGMYGLGLNSAFAHSVPKASLPLLWADCPFECNGKPHIWQPLFLGAKV